MKLNKAFFRENQVPQYSAANIFCFSIAAFEGNLFNEFEKRAKCSNVQLPDRSEELKEISQLSTPEQIVDYMRKTKSMVNIPQLIDRVLEFEEETMSLILKRFLNSSVDVFIETAGKCFVKADIKYTYLLKEQYNLIRCPYAKAVACLVFGIQGLSEETEFLYNEFNRMKLEHTDEDIFNFPLLALHILHNKQKA